MTKSSTERHGHPYYIVTPDYRESSAGVRVMHRLCHILNDQGFEAYIVGTDVLNPELKTPRLDQPTAGRHTRENRIPIAVYPEIISGNPINAPVCVRFMLNKEGVIDGNPINAGPGDLFFYYSRAFTPNTPGKFDYLRLNTHDLDVFKPHPNAKKKGPLLYLNRIPPSSIDFSVLPKNIEVLSNRTPLSLSALAAKLQSATILYSSESSATCTLAMLCGCPVVAMTLSGYEKLGFSKQALSIYGGRGYALTDSEEALQAARASLPAFREAVANVERQFAEELKAFVAKTQAKADDAARIKAPVSRQDSAHHSSIGTHPQRGGDSTEPAAWVAHRAIPQQFHIEVVVIGADPKLDAATHDSLQAQSHQADVVHHICSGPAASTKPLLQQRLQDACAPPNASTGTDPGYHWALLLDNGDRLQADAIASVACVCEDHPQSHWIHSDARVRNEDGSTHTLYPPDASPRLLRSGFALVGALAVRTDALRAALEHAEGLDADNWRQALPYLLLQSTGSDACVHVAEPWVTHRRVPKDCPELLVPPPHIEYGDEQAATPLVSILIPTRDQLPALQRCLETVFEHTRGIAFEIIVVAHETTDPAARRFLAGLPAAAPDHIRVVAATGPFNFSRLINQAAREARGAFLLLLNNDTAALHPEWLPALVDQMNDPEVGIVAPRLVFPDGRIQHAGAVLGLNGAADFPWVGVPMDEPGHLRLLGYAREVSAVSGAAMFVRRSLFETLGRMDEEYAIGFGDFDLCLRAQRQGYRCIWTPSATLLHEAGQTLKAVYASTAAATEAQRLFDAARARFLRTWLPQLGRDPCYNVNLSLTSKRYEPESDPVLQPFPAHVESALRVFALPADNSGSGAYRVHLPAECAVRQGVAATRIARGYPMPVQFVRLGIDTLFSQRQVDDNHLKALSELRGLLPDLRIVMDFDDLLTAVTQQNYFHATVWKDMPERLKKLAALSDCFTASTAPLAEAMRAYHDQVRHIPNGIDPARWPWPLSRNEQRKKLRVGWVGGISHAGDLAVVREVIAALAGEVDWVFLGMCLEDIQRHLHKFYPVVPFDQYAAKFASLDLDLAIAPLEINRFNDCKSNLRLLENGILGIPVIATDTTPYQCGLPVTLVDNRPDTWIAAIRERIGEHDALRRDGLALREAVLRDWTQERMLPLWHDAWAV